MPSPLSGERVNKAVDTVNKLVQIAAFLVAGAWALWSFLHSVAPTLEHRAGATSELHWSSDPDPTNCIGSLTIKIENEGIRAFDLQSFHIRGWLYTSSSGAVSSPTPTRPAFIDYNVIASKPTQIDKFFTKSLLITHYSSGTGFDETFDWLFKKEQGQGVVFITDFVTNGKDKFLPEDRSVGVLCETTPDQTSH
jgi:hypothetical protein